MNSRKYVLATACAAVLAATTAAQAGEKGLGLDLRPSHPTILASSDKFVTTKARTDIDAANLVDESVVNHKGETVGDIEAVIIGSTGKVRAVVVGVGGFLGLGEKVVALDWADLDISENGDEVRIRATAEQLKALPAYTYDNETRRGTIYEDDRVASKADRKDRELKESVAIKTLMDDRGNLRASEVIGMEVVNNQGEIVGDIEEVLISDNGKITAVLGAGGFLSIGETQLFVDWNRLEVRKSGDQAQIRTILSKEDLQKLPRN